MVNKQSKLYLRKEKGYFSKGRMWIGRELLGTIFVRWRRKPIGLIFFWCFGCCKIIFMKIEHLDYIFILVLFLHNFLVLVLD